MHPTRTLEHIARCIAHGVGSHTYARTCWGLHIPAARSALIAIKEPTLEMLEAVRPFLHPDWIEPMCAWWEVMVEAGLGEPPPEVSVEELQARIAVIRTTLQRVYALQRQEGR